MNLLFLGQDIFEILGLEKLAEEKKKALLEKMNEVMGQRIIFRIMDELSEADQEAFDKLTKKKASQEEINKFLSGKIDLRQIIIEEVAEFKEIMADDIKSLREELK